MIIFFLLISIYKKCTNYIIFVLLSIYKIAFGLLAFMYIAAYSDKELDFPYFKVRAFWKISMCCFYFFLIIYSCFQKKKNSSNIFLYILFALICFLGLFLSVYFTRTNNVNWELIICYLFYSGFEIIFTIIGIYSEKILELYFELCKCINFEMYIDLKIWKVNRIDICRYQFPIIFFLHMVIFKLCKKLIDGIFECCGGRNDQNSCCCLGSRFCKKLIKNFSGTR